MQVQSTKRGDAFQAIANAIAEANPPENARDTAHIDLALEVTAYLFDTYKDPAEGLAALADILRGAAGALSAVQMPADADCYMLCQMTLPARKPAKDDVGGGCF